MPPGRKNPEARLPYPETVVEITKAMNESCLEVPDRQIDLPGYQYDIPIHGFAFHVIICGLNNTWSRPFPPYGKSDTSIRKHAGWLVTRRSRHHNRFACLRHTAALGIQ
jgi:hypothetical protein